VFVLISENCRYKNLYEAPDPSRLLEVGCVAEARSIQLLEEIKETEEEFAGLQNQDITIRRLESDIEKLKAQHALDMDEALSKREEELMVAFEQRLKDSQKADALHTKRVHELKTKNAEQKLKLDKYQEEVFGLRASLEECEAAHQVELDLLSDDMQRANDSLLASQRECDDLKRSYEGGQTKNSGARNDPRDEHDRLRVLELEDELVRKHESEEQLRSTLKIAQEETAKLSKSHNQVVDMLEARIKKAEDQVFAFRSELNMRPTLETVNKLKSQLKMLQAIDSGEVDDIRDLGIDAQDDAFENKLLVHGRIRKLEATATSLRVELETCRKTLSDTCREKANLEERFKDQEQLMRKIEKGNVVLQRRASGSFRSNNQLSEESEYMNSGNGDNAVGFLLAATEDANINAGLATSMGEQRNDLSSESLLGIVHEQRNQFRKRMLELEMERDGLAKQVGDLTQDIESLQADNVSLFEKIKYLQNYTGQTNQIDYPGQRSSSPFSPQQSQFNNHQTKPNQSSELRLTVQGRQRGGDNLNENGVESRYKSLYEDKMNPFNDFSAREKRKRYKGLNAAEKITLKATNFFLSNKYTRSFVFFYAITLHLLVFLTLFASVNTSGNCVKRRPDHAAVAAKQLLEMQQNAAVADDNVIVRL